MNLEDEIFWHECEAVQEIGIERRREKLAQLFQIVKLMKDSEKPFPSGGDTMQFVARFNPPQRVCIEVAGQKYREKIEEMTSVEICGALLPVGGDLGFWNGSALILMGENFPLSMRYRAPEFIAAIEERNRKAGFEAAQILRDNPEMIGNFLKAIDLTRGAKVEEMEKTNENLSAYIAKLKNEAQSRRRSGKAGANR